MNKIYRLIFLATILLCSAMAFAQDEDCDVFELIPPLINGQMSNDVPPVPCGFNVGSDFYVNECSPCGSKISDDNCIDAPNPTICELDGFETTTAGYSTDLEPITGGFCGGGTGVHNNFWIGFTAQTNVIEIEVTTSNCFDTGGARGIQIAIADTNCSTEYETLASTSLLNSSPCTGSVTQGGLFNSKVQIGTASLVPGDPYYILLDGFAGGVCDLVINVVDGFGLPEYDISVNDPAQLCPDVLNPGEVISAFGSGGAIVDVAVGGIATNDLTFYWLNPSGDLIATTSGEILGPNTVRGSLDGSFFNENGDYSVQIIDNGSCCPLCTTVILEEADPPPAVAAVVLSTTGIDEINCNNNLLTVTGGPDPSLGNIVPVVEQFQIEDVNGVRQQLEVHLVNSDGRLNEIEITREMLDIHFPGEDFGSFNIVYGFLSSFEELCFADAFVTIDFDFREPEIDIDTPADLDCLNNPTVTLNALVDAADNHSTTLMWEAADGISSISDADTENPTVSNNGRYYVTVTDTENGCMSIDSIDVGGMVNPPELMPIADITLDCNVMTMAVSTSGDAGGDPITYSWTGPGDVDLGISDPALTADTDGTYTLTAVNTVNQCQSQTSFNVTVDMPTLTITDVRDSILTCDIQEITFPDALVAGGGVMGYTYSWMDPSNTEVSTDAALIADEDGTYTLTVTDVLTGCDVTITRDITLNQDSPVLDMLPADLVLNCTNNSMVSAIANATDDMGGAISGLTYEWFDDTGMSIGTDAQIDLTVMGTYDVIVTNPANGCTSTLPIVIDENMEMPDASIGDPDDITCAVSSVMLQSGSTTTDMLSYQWFQGDVSTGTALGTSEDQEALAPGDYSLIITNEVNGCTTEVNATVGMDMMDPVSDPGMDQVLNCFNMMTGVELDGTASAAAGTGTLTYQWLDTSGDAAGNTEMLNAMTDGTYTLIVTDMSNGCTSIETVEVTLDDAAPENVMATDGIISCTETSFTIEGSTTTDPTNLEFTWTDAGNNVFDPGIDLDVTSAGTYTLTVTNLDNGCSTTAVSNVENDDSVPMIIPTMLSGDAGPITCTNDNVVWTGVLGDPSNPDIDVVWTGPNGVIPGNMITFDMNTPPGSYTVTATDSANGCSSDGSITPLFDVEPPVINLTGGTIFCEPNSVTLSASDVDPLAIGTNFTWTDPSGMSLGAGISNPTVTTTGIFTAVAIGDNGCETIETVEVFDNTDMITALVAPNFELSCRAGEDTYALGGVGMNGDGSSNDLEYTWTLNNNVVSTDPNYVVSDPGTYTLTVVNTTNNCEESATVVVDDIRTMPIAVALPTQELNCVTPMVLLEGDSDDPNAEFVWTSENGTMLTGQMQMVDEPGDWMLTVTSPDNGCEAMAMVNIDSDFAPPENVMITGDNQLTCDANNVQLFGSTSSMLGADPYVWTLQGDNTPISTQQNPNFQSAGMYVLTVTGSNGCTATAEFEITSDENLPTPMTEVVGQITCDSGTAMILGSSSAPNTTFEWITPIGFTGDATSNDIVANASGEYILMITDNDNGCVSSTTAIVQANLDEPDLATSGTEITCVPGAVFTIEALSMVPDVTYTWTGPNGFMSDMANPEITEAGTYDVTITDPLNGCSRISSAEALEGRDNPEDRIREATIELLTCDDMVSELSASSSTAGVIFTWNGPGIIDEENSTVSTDQPGTYEVTYLDPSNGCSIVEQITIDIDITPPTISGLTPEMLNCQVTETQLGITNSEGIREYLWTGPSATALSDPTAMNPMANEPGEYRVVVIAEDNGCTSEAIIMVTEDMNIPVSTPSASVITCDFPTIELIGTGSTEGPTISYEWTGPNGFRSTDLNTTTDTPGMYTLTVFNSANLCEIPQMIMVMEDMVEPTADAGLDADFACADAFVTLSGSGTGTGQASDLTYLWTTSDGVPLGTTASIDVVQSGTFILQVRDELNGCTMTDEVVITPDENKPVPTIAEPLVLTCGTLDVTLDASGTTGIGALDYAWTGPNGNPIGSGENISVNEPGIYTLFVVDGSNGCDETATIEVFENIDSPMFSTVDGELDCISGSTDVLIESLTSTNSSFSWTGPGGFTATTEDLIGVTAAGSYSVTVTDIDNECTTVQTANVSESVTTPDATIGNPETLDCDTESVQLMGNTSNEFTFAWTGPSASSILSDGNTLMPIVGEAGVYELLVTDPSNGCINLIQVEVLENTNVITGINPQGDDVNCFGPNTGSISIEPNLVTGGEAPYVYSIDGGDSFGTQEDFLGLTAGQYDVVVMDINGCLFDQTLTIDPALDLALDLGENLVVPFGDSININTDNNNFDIDVITWSDSTLLGENPNTGFLSNTITYEVTAFDADGCVITDNITIFVEKTRPVYIPSAFSPNGDGINDFFTVYADIDLIEYIHDFAIYDRWGEQVYFNEMQSPEEALLDLNGWDGNFRTESMSPGVYVYKVLVEFVDGEEIFYEGDITLIR